MTHYERLGVAPGATPTEIRDAYRRAARAAHPDRHGDDASPAMAEINEAWRVVGDPVRRRAYDDELRRAAEAASRTSATPPQRRRAGPVAPPAAAPVHHPPARFPWRFMAGLAVAGIGLVVIGHLLTEPAPEPAPDGLLTPGSCVTIAADLSAGETSCSGPYDAVVEVLVPFAQPCPTGTESYRDRQGMGTACVVRPAP